MARWVDLDELLDAAGVAEVLGLASRNSISTYRGRYGDFPAPVRTFGASPVWTRQQIEVWRRRRSTTPSTDDAPTVSA